jgi:TonB family protein
MRKSGKKTFHRGALLVVLFFLLAGVWGVVFYLASPDAPWWNILRREGRRILGRDFGGISAREHQIREEVILKKMEEASAQRDWRDSVPEYPRPRKLGSLDAKEKIRILKETPEFKETDAELQEYLKKSEDFFYPEMPAPSPESVIDVTRLKDRGTDAVIARLLGSKERGSAERPLDENLQLGIQGPLVFRRIMERPPPPQVRVRVEAEIEMTVIVLPNGTVDRVTPSVKGDAELERIAVQYLKQWRFAPLPKEEPQVEQWGTLPMKFRLQ